MPIIGNVCNRCFRFDETKMKILNTTSKFYLSTKCVYQSHLRNCDNLTTQFLYSKKNIKCVVWYLFGYNIIFTLIMIFNERLRLESASSIPFFQLVCSYRTIDEIIAFTHLKGNTNKCNLWKTKYTWGIYSLYVTWKYVCSDH